MAIAINPKTLNSADGQALFNFFEAQRKLGIHVWQANHEYTFGGKTFVFAEKVIERQRKEGKSGYRYEFISTKSLGKGCFGEVFAVSGTLALDSTAHQYKVMGEYCSKKTGEIKKRAVKVQAHNSDYPIDRAKTEYQLSKKAAHLAIKAPVEDGQTSYLVMRELPGRELEKILQDDKDKIAVLTPNQRHELTKALLRALKTQVTDKGLIHRDLKPSNIMVDMSTSPPTVNIFDFNLSTTQTAPDNKAVGTPLYITPEFLYGPYTSKMDVFTMGRVIEELWGEDDFLNAANLLICLSYANTITFDRLFHFDSTKDLDTTCQQAIKKTLLGMLAADKDARSSIETAIKDYDKVEIKFDSKQAAQGAVSKNSSIPVAAAEPTIRAMNISTGNRPALSVHKEPDINPYRRKHAELQALQDKLSEQLENLNAKRSNLKKREERDVAVHLKTLYKDLNRDVLLPMLSLSDQDSAQRKKDVETIQKALTRCREVITDNKDLIDSNRDYKYLAGNFLLALAGIGVFYLGAVLINKGVTGRYLFFGQTKTSKLVEEVSQTMKAANELLENTEKENAMPPDGLGMNSESERVRLWR